MWKNALREKQHRALQAVQISLLIYGRFSVILDRESEGKKPIFD